MIRDIFRNVSIPLLVCIAFGLFEFAPVRDSVATFFISSESVSDDLAIAQSIENCKSSVRAQAVVEWRTRDYDPSWNLEKCETVKNMGRAIAEGRDSLMSYQRKESYYQISREIRDIANVIQAISLILILILILRNAYVYILKGQFGVDLFDTPRRLVSSQRSRSAEKELLRYKNLFDNGLISEEEFSTKKKELIPSILNSR